MNSCGSCGVIAAIRSDMEAFEKFLNRKPVPDFIYFDSAGIPNYDKIKHMEDATEEVVRILLQAPVESTCSHIRTNPYRKEVGEIPLYRVLMRFTNPATYSLYLTNTELDPMDHFGAEFPHLYNYRYTHYPVCYKDTDEFFPLTDPIDLDLPEHFLVTLKRWPEYLIDEDMTPQECYNTREIEEPSLLQFVFHRFYTQYYESETVEENPYLSLGFFSAVIECGVELNAIQWPKRPILSFTEYHGSGHFDKNVLLISYFISHGLMDFRSRVDEWIPCQIADFMRFRYVDLQWMASTPRLYPHLTRSMAKFQNALKNFQIFLQLLVSLDLAHLVPSYEKYIEGHVRLTSREEINNPVIPIFQQHLIEMRRPISLQNIARNCIRKELGGQDFQKKVELLPLPDLGKDAVRADYTWALENVGGFCQ